MSANPAQSNAAVADEENRAPRAPLCFVVDGDDSIRQFLSLILHGVGIDTEEFPDGQGLRAALARRQPDLVFLDIPIESAGSIACVGVLGDSHFRGRVQLMSSRGSAVLTHVKTIGEQRQLQMLPVMRKPFETSAVLKVLHQHKLGDPPAVAGRIDLDEALAKGWIEFWYQPKIDLRKKQLVGTEAYARARHPQYGVLLPNAFIPGASEASLIKLAEETLRQALGAALNFSRLGLNLRMAINMPLAALTKVPIAEVVGIEHAKFSKWPGLLIDVDEAQILTNLALADDFTKKHEQLNVQLALDNFGRGYSSLTELKKVPFAELKLDRAFVTDCGTDKVNAPLCRTVIDLAHSFGSTAVAIGIEKASDALALVSMGCDCGQGFLLGQPMPEERFLSLLRHRTGTPKGQMPVPAAEPALEKRTA